MFYRSTVRLRWAVYLPGCFGEPCPVSAPLIKATKLNKTPNPLAGWHQNQAIHFHKEISSTELFMQLACRLTPLRREVKAKSPERKKILGVEWAEEGALVAAKALSDTSSNHQVRKPPSLPPVKIPARRACQFRATLLLLLPMQQTKFKPPPTTTRGLKARTWATSSLWVVVPQSDLKFHAILIGVRLTFPLFLLSSFFGSRDVHLLRFSQFQAEAHL